jgi:hypothetical protein
LGTFTAVHPFWSPTVTDDGNRVALYLRTNTVAVVEAKSGKLVAPPLTVPNAIGPFLLSPEGQLLVTI